MSSSIGRKDQNVLCTKSGNRCAMPDCRKELVAEGNDKDRSSLVAQMAHIKGEKPGSARYDAGMADADRNKHENLILVCPSCHKKIDDQPNTYTVEKLVEIKQSHEQWIIESTRNEMTNITFAELGVVTKYLMSGQATTGDSLTLITPRDKIKKNGLSQTAEQLILMGMTQVKQVGSFIEKCPDIEFADRLRQGFVAEYSRLRNTERISGDDLFNAMHNYASGQSTDFKQRAAGLAVLVYLFEKCEVFEK